MFTKHMLFRLHKAKSGMGTVLGMLIFIGVMFTCVIPLFLYVNEVNSFYDQTVVEMRQYDQEHEVESLYVYAFPVGDESPYPLHVYVKNKCALDVRVVRVWVNDTFYDGDNLPTYLPLLLSGVSEGTVMGIDISQGYFDIWVTTDRGNVFASLSNTVHVTEGGWSPGAYNFAIPIYITGAGTYEVTVTDYTSFTDYVTIKSAPTAYRMLQVPKPGTYNVTVTRAGGGPTWPDFQRTVDWEFPVAQQIEVST